MSFLRLHDDCEEYSTHAQFSTIFISCGKLAKYHEKTSNSRYYSSEMSKTKCSQFLITSFSDQSSTYIILQLPYIQDLALCYWANSVDAFEEKKANPGSWTSISRMLSFLILKTFNVFSTEK